MDAREVLKTVAEALKPYATTNPDSEEAKAAVNVALSIMDGLDEGKKAFLDACGIDLFAGQFMQPSIRYDSYYLVETSLGTEYVPADVVSLGVDTGVVLSEGNRQLAWKFEDSVERLKDYVEGTTIASIELKEGWMARMSAAGYMDCTDWSVHDNEDEAFQYLVDNYGEDV